MNKLITTVIVVLFGLALTACGSAKAGTTVTSWDGTWKSSKVHMQAEISGNVITIHIVDDESQALYWKGTWDSNVSVKDGAVIVSKADAEALDSSLLGSEDRTKRFTFKKNELLYYFSLMGTSTTVHLEKS